MFSVERESGKSEADVRMVEMCAMTAPTREQGKSQERMALDCGTGLNNWFA